MDLIKERCGMFRALRCLQGEVTNVKKILTSLASFLIAEADTPGDAVYVWTITFYCSTASFQKDVHRHLEVHISSMYVNKKERKKELKKEIGRKERGNT